MAKPIWCGEYSPLTDHPLNWSNLEAKLEPFLSTSDYEKAYLVVVDEFMQLYGDQNESLTAQLTAKVEAYLERRQVQGERPFDWASILVSARNSEMLVLGNNENYVHEMSCDNRAWLDKSSAEVSIFYLAYAMKQIAHQ